MTFANCSAAYEQGYANIPRSSPLYARKLDRDNDGIACEQPPEGFTPHKAPQTSTGTKVQSNIDNGATLPKTGAGEVGVVGVLVLIVGVVSVAISRRKRVRFTA